MEKIKWKENFHEAYWTKGDRLRCSYPQDVFESILTVCNFCKRNDPGWCSSAECEVFELLAECIEELKDLSNQLDKEMQAGYEEMRNDCCQEI